MKTFASALVLAALTIPALAATDVVVDAPMACLIKSHEFPGGGLCNDIALKGQGANKDAYVTDTKNGRVLKLAPGSDAFTVWYVNDKSDPSLDGLVWKGDTLYTNTYNGNHVIAVPMKAEGSTAYVLEAKLNYQRDPALKGKDPGTFTAYAVPLK